MIHYAGLDGSNWFFCQMQSYNIIYDIIGISYYPFWHGKNLNTMKTVINNLAIEFNKPVLIAEDSSLKQTIELTRKMVLSYKDDFFEFEFAALHYSSPEEIRYAYLMENLDEEWVFVKDRRFASYTNVPPGEYVFRVTASNKDGVWNETGSSIRIIILPPWWATWGAYFLYFVLIISNRYTLITNLSKSTKTKTEISFRIRAR